MNTQAKTVRQVTVEIVHGVVDGGAGGNPAGVVLDADELGEQDMQTVAARVGMSETAFVSESKTEGFKLDFFTPNRLIAHCGHATIAAFSHLDALGRIPNPNTSKETVDGPKAEYFAGRAPLSDPISADEIRARSRSLTEQGVAP